MRTDALARVLDAENVDAFFACTPISMGYLHGFFEDAHERFLVLAVHRSGAVRAILPSLSETQAKRAGILDTRPWSDGDDPSPLIAELAADWSIKSAVIDDMAPAKTLLMTQSAAPLVSISAGQPLLAEIMRRKDASELDLLRKSAAIADDVFEALKAYIRPGLTELQVERFIREAFVERGGSPTFCIVGAGAGGAEPHHLNGDTVLSKGDVVILDFGCAYERYQSDITRTVCLGPATDRQREVYSIVYEAYRAGRAAIRPGVTSASVDSAARTVIEEAGFGPQFFHRLGHGIGMNGHEDPNIIGSSSQLLQAGDCFSIEPGIYLPGEFGVRIETIVTCTEDGHENLNAEPSPTLLEL